MRPIPICGCPTLHRVEVLEGPQGTLYGAGSLGGIIRLVPNAPELGVASGSAMIGGSATQHGALGGDASATINLPLAEDVAALRITLDAATQGGYIDKPLLGRRDVNRTNILGGRAAVRIDAGGGWTVDLIGVGQTNRGRDSQYADRAGPPLTPRRAGRRRLRRRLWARPIRGFGRVRALSVSAASTGMTGQHLEERYDATIAR